MEMLFRSLQQSINSKFADKNHLLSKITHAFELKKIALLNEIVRTLHDSQCTILVILDFREAFDSFIHYIRINILLSLGIPARSFRLYQSCLTSC